MVGAMRGETNKEIVETLMRRLGTHVRAPGRVYFTGGVSAVLFGWRAMTVDVDFKADPEPLGFFEALPRVKEDLNINLELASPEDFIPALPGWRDRSRFIARHGQIDFYHYDFYSQALAKLERDHPRDRLDVGQMLAHDLIEKGRLQGLFLEIEAALIRYPAIDPADFRARVFAFTNMEHA